MKFAHTNTITHSRTQVDTFTYTYTPIHTHIYIYINKYLIRTYAFLTSDFKIIYIHMNTYIDT